MRSSSFGLFLLSCAVLLLTGAPRPVHASDLSYARIVRVSLVSGDVQISRPGHTGWEAATENMPVTQGVTIGTNNGYAEIEFEDGATAWISGDTLVQFTELALADGGRITKLTIGQGTMSVLTALHRGDSFALSTSQETIGVPKNALFRVDSFHDGASVSVLGGEVEVDSAAGTKTVPKGKTLAYQSKLTDVSLTANPRPDGWDRWVVERAHTSQTETAQSLSYVNAPFSYGLADMSAYGGWNYFVGYGYGWQPYGVGNCWMPFMNGQWGFYPGFGWTWISAEPWGWTPYHFGSWDFLPSYGWTWFPSGFGSWDPAPVDWYSAGNQVGWWPSGFSDPSQLMFEQMMGGCSGYGAGYGVGTRLAMRMNMRPPKTTGGGTSHWLPRLMLTTNRLGQNDSIGILAYYDGDGQKAPIRSAEPLENGKPSTIAFSALAASATPRVLVPTAPDIVHLQRSSVAVGTSVSPMKPNPSMPSAPPRDILRAVNAMPVPTMPSHRPAPMSSSRASNANSIQGYFPQGSASAAGWSAAPARASSSASAPAGSAHGGGGKPN